MMAIMRSLNSLNGVDLNLLVVLDALLAERHVTRAALRINKTQPAVSHALARLRVLFDDPILVRSGGRLEPTARALELAVPLREALSVIGGLMDERAFDPMTSDREIRLSMSDYAAEVVLPSLVGRLSRQAPRMALRLVSLGREAALSAIRSGEVDLAIGVYPAMADGKAEGLRFAPLFEDRFACLVDEACAPPLRTLEDYLSRPHVAVAASPQDIGEVDAALARLGRSRRVVVTLPHWSVAPALVKGTDLVLTAARKSLLARRDEGLEVVEPPFDLAPIPLVQAWHARRDFDPAHRWVQAEIKACVSAPDAT